MNRELWFHEIYGYCGLSFVLFCAEHCENVENAVYGIDDCTRRVRVGEMKLQIGLIVFGLIERHIFSGR